MATYEIDITKRLMKTLILTIPDSVSAEDAEEWAEDNAYDLFDVERYQGEVKWAVDDLSEGEVLEVIVKETINEDEFEIEGFGLAD